MKFTTSQPLWYSNSKGGEMRRAIPKTHQALDWIGKGMTAAQAARKMEISESSVYAALRKTKAKDLGCCPTCGHKLRK
jgi:transposase